MNKISPHKLRDLDVTLPSGTECYLCNAVRNALLKYRHGYEPAVFLDKKQAVTTLANNLGRGLKRFLQDEIQATIQGQKIGKNRMAL